MQEYKNEQLSNLQRLQQLDQAGHLRPLIKAGYFPYKVLLHLDIYMYVDAQRKMGFKPKRAIGNAEELFRTNRATIYRILKSFR